MDAIAVVADASGTAGYIGYNRSEVGALPGGNAASDMDVSTDPWLVCERRLGCVLCPVSLFLFSFSVSFLDFYVVWGLNREKRWNRQRSFESSKVDALSTPTR